MYDCDNGHAEKKAKSVRNKFIKNQILNENTPYFPDKYLILLLIIPVNIRQKE